MSTFIFSSCNGIHFMLYKITLAFCLLLAAKHIGLAQTNISGKFVDKHNKPVEFATLSLLNAQDSSLVKKFISNSTGDNVLPHIAEGPYLLCASMMGYINAGLQYSCWERNASLKLSANVLFITLVFSGESVVGENNIRLESRRESRRLNLTFNYRFGNNESKPVGRKRGASSDEQERIKGSGD